MTTMQKLTPRQTEILESMQPDTWYKPGELKTSQRLMSELVALKLVRRKTMNNITTKGSGFTGRLESAVYCLRGDA